MEALLFEQAGEAVRCLTCERRCELRPGEQGWCRTRQNLDGRIRTLTWGVVSSLSADPVEKKPLYHFHPGSAVFTAGSWSCNFSCPWCQNWQISKSQGGPMAAPVPPGEFVGGAQARGCQGIALSYNEPTLSLEWGCEAFREALLAGLYTCIVTNGYMTPMALELMARNGLQALNVDVKGGPDAVRRHCGADVECVWRNCARALALGLHLEITTLLVPGVSDSEESISALAGRLRGELGQDVPWHLTAYHPDWQFTARPTAPETLRRAWHIARAAGLHYVYTGNMPGDEFGDTFCAGCHAAVIRRSGFEVVFNGLRSGRCPVCGARVAGVL
ncbi:MAG: AmmeMemoRadiSam system radical SAM enzyme [Candidatus Solibacter usitatus]|nr:AmmeMemoRadiSam system radical SAM enzyme [Candidatus Solibacter usitatus]